MVDITHILVHQTRFTDTTVAEDDHLENVVFMLAIPIYSYCYAAHINRTFNKTFFRDDMAVGEWGRLVYIRREVGEGNR